MIPATANKETNPVIVTVANKNYCIMLGIMLLSIESTLEPGSRIKIYVLHSGLEEQIKNEMGALLKTNKIKVSWIEINKDRLHNVKVSGHITIETYYRLLIEETLLSYSKVIYLDSDLIVTGSITELWNYNLGETYLLAVPMASRESGYVCGNRGVPSHKIIGIPEKTRTFNAGVMIINLDKWRREKISERVLKYLDEFKDYVLWWDQDGLNAVLYNKWVPLPAVWNVMVSHLSSFNTWKDSLLTEDEFRAVSAMPKIIHFSGPDKPWLTGYDGPFKALYTEYFTDENLIPLKRLLSKQIVNDTR